MRLRWRGSSSSLRRQSSSGCSSCCSTTGSCPCGTGRRTRGRRPRCSSRASSRRPRTRSRSRGSSTTTPSSRTTTRGRPCLRASSQPWFASSRSRTSRSTSARAPCRRPNSPRCPHPKTADVLVEVPWLTIAATAAATAPWLLAVAVVYLRRRPDEPEPGPPTLDLGPEPPAIANLLVHDFRVTRDAVPATLIDLAARRLVEIEEREPGSYVCRLEERSDGKLTSYERRGAGPL